MTDPHLNRADIHGMRKMALKEINVITIQQPISVCLMPLILGMTEHKDPSR